MLDLWPGCEQRKHMLELGRAYGLTATGLGGGFRDAGFSCWAAQVEGCGG